MVQCLLLAFVTKTDKANFFTLVMIARSATAMRGAVASDPARVMAHCATACKAVLAVDVKVALQVGTQKLQIGDGMDHLEIAALTATVRPPAMGVGNAMPRGVVPVTEIGLEQVAQNVSQASILLAAAATATNQIPTLARTGILRQH